MERIEVAAGTALVGVMAGAGWPAARAEVVAFWRQVRPGEADDVAADLTEVRAEVLAARQAGDPALERALAEGWQRRLRDLVQGDPDLAAGLRHLVDQHLVPALPADERAGITSRLPDGDPGPG
ncbi:hypothetical protein AAH979_25840 [Plantactinospora sp. ZYX-F-223]|uniref:hypothetical protein n=1 Tax=Plantactinospora sp. ZYX-F-223 TaxID=3144103 RepID=UPI0031FD9F64